MKKCRIVIEVGKKTAPAGRRRKMKAGKLGVSTKSGSEKERVCERRRERQEGASRCQRNSRQERQKVGELLGTAIMCTIAVGLNCFPGLLSLLWMVTLPGRTIEST